MKPATCCVCGKFGHLSTGEWVKFADYHPAPMQFGSHPEGFEWFCKDHLPAAEAVSSMSSADAIACLKRQYLELDDPIDVANERLGSEKGRNALRRIFLYFTDKK